MDQNEKGPLGGRLFRGKGLERRNQLAYAVIGVAVLRSWLVAAWAGWVAASVEVLDSALLAGDRIRIP